MDRGSKPADRLPLEQWKCRTSSRPRHRTNCARARRGPRHLRVSIMPLLEASRRSRSYLRSDRSSWPPVSSKACPDREATSPALLSSSTAFSRNGWSCSRRSRRPPPMPPSCATLRPAGIGTVRRLAIGGIGLRVELRVVNVARRGRDRKRHRRNSRAFPNAGLLIDGICPGNRHRDLILRLPPGIDCPPSTPTATLSQRAACLLRT